jgi:hypothetical protein
MKDGKLPEKRRHSAVDPIHGRVEEKPEEFCLHRELAHPSRLTERQEQALEALKARRDLFL